MKKLIVLVFIALILVGCATTSSTARPGHSMTYQDVERAIKTPVVQFRSARLL